MSRKDHAAAVISLSPGLTEVVMFGGCPEWSPNYSDDETPKIANTTVLRFGELSPCCTLSRRSLYCFCCCLFVIFVLFFI